MINGSERRLTETQIDQLFRERTFSSRNNSDINSHIEVDLLIQLVKLQEESLIVQKKILGNQEKMMHPAMPVIPDRLSDLDHEE